MKFKKRISAILLALVMLVTLVPQTVFADTGKGDTGLKVTPTVDNYQLVAFGGSVTLGVTATVTDGSEDKLTYYWDKITTDSNDQDEYETVATGVTSYIVENVTSYTRFECSVRDQYGTWGSAWFFVYPDSGLTVNPVGDTYRIVPVGESATLGVSATVADGSEDKLTYTWGQWLYNPKTNDCDIFDKVMKGATSNSFTVHNITERIGYLCAVGDQYGYYDYTFFELVPDSGLTVDDSPKEITVAENDSVTLNVNATVNDGTITYHWFNGDSEITNASGNAYTVNNVSKSTSYKCQVVDQYGYFKWVTFNITVPQKTSTPNAGQLGAILTTTASADQTIEALTATNFAGKTIETTTAINSAGKTVTVTTTTNKDSAGNVTSVTEKSAIEEVAKNTAATVTVEKNADGKVISAAATVTQTATADDTKTKVSLSKSVVSQIQEAGGQKDVDITLKSVDASGKTKYTVTVNAKDVKAGNDLYAYALNNQTGEYTMVDSNTYTVSEKGTVSFSNSKKATYVLVNASDAKKINKDILATAKLTKTSKTVKAGKTANVTISKKLNTSNVKSIQYTSTKKSVATVSKNGKVTAKSAGKTTIKAQVTFKNGSTKILKLKVTVK